MKQNKEFKQMIKFCNNRCRNAAPG